MKVLNQEIVHELSHFVDLSCKDSMDYHLYSEFHEMLIRMCYLATDVTFNYNESKVAMKVLAEHESYDSSLVNLFAEVVPVTVVYSDLQRLLKCCILENREGIHHYYPFLNELFLNSKSSLKLDIA